MFNSYPREIGWYHNTIHNSTELERYINCTNGYDNCWISLYSFRNIGEDYIFRESANIDCIYFDVDGEGAYKDIIALNEYFNNYRRSVMFSGNWFNLFVELDTIYRSPTLLRLNTRKIVDKLSLKTICVNGVGNVGRMVGIPETINVKSRLFKTCLSEAELRSGMNNIKTIAKKQRLKNGCIDWNIIGDKPYILENLKPPKMPDNITGEVKITHLDDIPIIPCLEHTIIKGCNPTHRDRWLLTLYLAEVYTESLVFNISKELIKIIHDYMKKLMWRDYNYKKTDYQICHTLRKYHNSPLCETLNEMGLCKGKCWRYNND